MQNIKLILSSTYTGYLFGTLSGLLALFTPIVLKGQTGNPLIPEIAEIAVFDVGDGLPLACTYNSVTDHQGRLWISPCFSQIPHQTIDFYQFDGRESHLIGSALRPPYIQGQMSLSGISSEGILYGFFRGSGTIFLFDPDSGACRFHSIPENNAEVVYINATDKTNTIVFAESSAEFQIYDLKRDTLQLIYRQQRKYPPFPKYLADQIDYNFDGSHMWFVELDMSGSNASRKLFLHRIDIHTLKDQEFDITYVLHPIAAPGISMSFYQNKMYLMASSGQIISIDNDNVKAVLPDLFSKPAFNVLKTKVYNDAKGNMLLMLRVRDSGVDGKKTSIKAFLLSHDGGVIDYTKIINAAATSTRLPNSTVWNIYAQDLERKFMLMTEGGLVAVDLKQKNSVKMTFAPFATRSISQFPNGDYVVLQESTSRLARFDHSSGKVIVSPSEDRNISVVNMADIRRTPKGDLYFVSGLAHDKSALIHISPDNHRDAFSFPYPLIRFDLLNDHTIIFAQLDSLFRFDLNSGKLNSFGNEASQKLITDHVTQILIARDQSAWITSLDGLWHYDLKNGTSKYFGKEAGFPDIRMMCLLEDDSGRLWIGTYGSGFYIFDPVTGSISTINTDDGLSNNIVIGILADDEGYKWLATFHGLTVVSKEGKVLTRIYEEDGLTQNEFNRYSCYKDSKGNLLFGSVDGVNLIEPKSVIQNLVQADTLSIYPTSLSYFDRSSHRQKTRYFGFGDNPHVNLPASFRNMQIQFAVSNFIRQNENEYIYRILDKKRGDSTEWISTGSNPELNLLNLQAGTFQIEIRGSDYRKQWTKRALTIDVTAAEFFYKQSWFFITLLCLGIGLIFLWQRRIKAERSHLQQMVEERTQELKIDKETIELQTQKLAELDAVKTKFFTNISHELRTPLSVISGMAEQLNSDPNAPELIHRNAVHLLNLVNQILDLRKLEVGTLKVNYIQANIVDYIRYLAESFCSLAEQNNLSFHIVEEIPDIVMDFDPEKILRIISNLISNAIKFTPAFGNIYLTIGSQLVDGREFLQFSIRDTGMGIPDTHIDKIFDRFYQVNQDNTDVPEANLSNINGSPFSGRSGGGTGVGLALTRELVKLMEGTIEVKSELGISTIFTVCLPVHHEAIRRDVNMDMPISGVSPVRDKTAASVDAESDKKKNTPLDTVLVVEDNADVRYFLKQCLSNAGYQIYEANNGLKGMDMAREYFPDLIVTDVMMPVMDGYAFSQRIRGDILTSHIPIVMLTAKAAEEDRIAGLETGVDDYLIKPFSQRELIVRVSNLIRMRKELRNRFMYAGNIQPAEVSMVSLDKEFMELVIRTIQLRLHDENFTVSLLSDAVHMSTTHLNRKLHALINQSAGSLIRSMRLQRGFDLIKANAGSVTEIAFKVGFSSLESFSRNFKKQFGASPSEFQ